jgi:hypothetical protein
MSDDFVRRLFLNEPNGCRRLFRQCVHQWPRLSNFFCSPFGIFDVRTTGVLSQYARSSRVFARLV